MSVTTKAATPSSWKRLTASSTLTPDGVVQPHVAVSPPRASRPTATRRGWRVARRRTKPGCSSAAVPITTLATPASSSASAENSSRTPPPDWTGTAMAAAMEATISRLTAIPVRAASRSTTCTHGAPSVANSRALATGSPPYTVSRA